MWFHARMNCDGGGDEHSSVRASGWPISRFLMSNSLFMDPVSVALGSHLSWPCCEIKQSHQHRRQVFLRPPESVPETKTNRDARTTTTLSNRPRCDCQNTLHQSTNRLRSSISSTPAEAAGCHPRTAGTATLLHGPRHVGADQR